MIREFEGKTPKLHPKTYVDPSAILIGDVTISKASTIWPSAVLRGDFNQITVGKEVSIQDNVSIHASPTHKVNIGNGCIIGHNAVVNSSDIEGNVLIGMGAIVNGSHIEQNSIIAAGAVLHQQHIEPKSMVMGIPGETRRTVKEEEVEMIKHLKEEYRTLGERYNTETSKNK